LVRPRHSSSYCGAGQRLTDFGSRKAQQVNHASSFHHSFPYREYPVDGSSAFHFEIATDALGLGRGSNLTVTRAEVDTRASADVALGGVHHSLRRQGSQGIRAAEAGNWQGLVARYRGCTHC
jgi:hypothetical protein